MTIKDVLKADWTVDNINVTVRDAATMKFITEYHIGENLLYPMYFYCFESIQETKAGTLYKESGMKHLYMERMIQHRHLPMEDKKRGQEWCVGVLLERIPKELLELEIDHMMPYSLGSSSGMHGYHFDCNVGMWFGIPGENEEVEEEPEEEESHA